MKGTPSKPECGFSKRVVNILQQHKVNFKHFNVFDDFILKEQLKDFANWKSYPQLWIDGKL